MYTSYILPCGDPHLIVSIKYWMTLQWRSLLVIIHTEVIDSVVIYACYDLASPVVIICCDNMICDNLYT